jgi:hypothetical protein
MAAAHELKLQLFDVNGFLLRKWERNMQSGTANFTLQPSLDKGLYLMKIADENGQGHAVKLVVY